MKKIFAVLVCLIGFCAHTQSWLDGKCKTLDQTITSSEFNEANQRNILSIIINQADEFVINGEVKPDLKEIAFKELVLDFVTNPKQNKNKASNPDKVYIQLSSFKQKSSHQEEFKNYIQEVYIYLWDKLSSEKYNSSYVELNCRKRSKVFNQYPLRIVTSFEKKSKQTDKPPMNLGIPPFKGDVDDN